MCLVRVSHTIAAEREKCVSYVCLIRSLLRERSVSRTCVSHDLHSNAAEREVCLLAHTHTRMAQESAGTRAKASPESPEPTSGGVCDQFDPFDPWQMIAPPSETRNTKSSK